jgi:DNA-binding LacI/PurR family transcriptional regulator
MPAATVYDVARAAGVSVATITRALTGYPHVSPKTRERVQLHAARLQYVPNHVARGLRSRRTMTIALVTSPPRGFELFARTAGAMAAYAASQHYEVVIAIFDHDSDVASARLREVLSHRVDGAVFVNTDPPEALQRFLALCEEHDVRAVLPCPVDGKEALVVGIDRRGGTAAAAKHLIGLGRRRLGYFGGVTGHYTNAMKLQGLTDAVREVGLTFEDADVWPASSAQPFADLVACAAAFLGAKPHLDALLSEDDRAGAAAVRAALRAGRRVPEDLSVIGFNGSETSETCEVPLTTVAQPLDVWSRLAFDVAIGREPVSPRPPLLLSTTLLVRDSCGARRT